MEKGEGGSECRFPAHIQNFLTTDAHSADAPRSSIAPIIDAGSGFRISLTEILQESTPHDGIGEDNYVVTADAFGQPNAVHNEGGDQDDPNLDGDATGEDNAPEARNHWAGDVQLVPVHDTILELLVDLPEPTKQWIYPTLETF